MRFHPVASVYGTARFIAVGDDLDERRLPSSPTDRTVVAEESDGGGMSLKQERRPMAHAR